MEIEAIYKLYSQTVLEPVSFEEFITGNKNKLRQAYQAGIVAPMSQLSQIDYFHKSKCDYDVGFQNGIKLAIGILVSKNVELVKPEPVIELTKPVKTKKAKKKKE